MPTSPCEVRPPFGEKLALPEFKDGSEVHTRTFQSPFPISFPDVFCFGVRRSGGPHPVAAGK